MTATGRLILVRHGQTEGNVAKILDTALPGAPLTALGHEQAHEVGENLARITAGREIAEIITSEALRAQQTGEGILAGLKAAGASAPEPHTWPGIKEIAAGELEGEGTREAMGRYVKVCRAWLSGDSSPSLPGGETHKEFLERFQPLVDHARTALSPTGPAAGKDIIVVSHGAAIRMLVTGISIVDPALMKESLIANCGLVILAPPQPDQAKWFVHGWEKVSFQAKLNTFGG